MSGSQVNYPDPGFWTKTSMIQLGYGVWVNLSLVTIGLAYGFSAVSIPQLQSSDSSIYVTIDDASWIASVLPLLAPIGCILCGYLIDKFGRRTMLIYSHIPVSVGWIYTGIANTAKNIIIGRMIIGFGIGMVMSVPRVYMTEVSLPNMRGVIGSFPNIAISIGIALQAGLGSFLQWTMLCYISCVYALSLLLLNIHLPETPYYLIKKGSVEDAQASLEHFRSKGHNIEAEMEEILDFKNGNNICRLTFKEELVALFKRSSCRPFWIMMIYILFGQLSGASIILMWTVDMLERSKSTVSAEMGNIILGITRIIVGIIAAVLIFNVGRRPLALTSGLGVSTVCISLGLLIEYQTQYTLLPLIGFILFITFVTTGYYTLPPIMMFELYPLQVRGILGGISLTNINLYIFAVNKCYPYVRDFLGFSYLVIAFGISSLLGKVNYPDPGFWTKTSMIQLGYGIWVNLSMVTIGLAYGFSSVMIPQLQSSDSSIPVTIDDASWIASVLTLLAPIGCILCGYLIDKFGRRTMLIYSHLPVFAGWIYTGMANSAKNIIIGRMIIGFGMGMVMSVPRVYMTEVSLPNMRGVIGSFPSIAMSIGITIQAGLGSFLQWKMLCYISCAFALSLFFLNIYLPETPYYLIKKETAEDAEASLKCFRSKKYNFEAEMEEIIDFKNENDIRRLNFKEQLGALFKGSSCKPFGIMMGYFVIAEFSGASVLFMWTVDMLERSNLTISGEMGNLVLGVTRIISGILVSVLIFNIGRRPLAIGSALGVGIVCVSLGLLIEYQTQSTLLPLIGYILYITFVTTGYYSLPALMMYELYPLQVRGLLGGISLTNLNLLIFSINKCYPYVQDFCGFSYVIMGFGISSLLGCIFLYFFLPETKDLTLQEIEEYYNDRRSTLTSQRRILSVQLLNTLERSGTSSRSLIKVTDKHKKGSKVTFSDSGGSKDNKQN